ncbi:hypothetical protein ONZ45_g18235 [Pleurotus djamor]|nr:hypothetical protein ONZ45_g18235 [Pleurotus djamor]
MATSRVVFLPEFLIGLFKYLTERDYARCALVCKVWSDLVLDCAWREIRSFWLYKLFQLLAPLAQDNESNLNYFARPIQPGAWEIFKKYSRRIRVLDCDNHDLHSSVFSLVASTCPFPGPLLPNLCEFSSGSDFNVTQLFASTRGPSPSSSNITTYHLENDCAKGRELELTVQFIPEWMPNIQHMTLDPDTEAEFSQELAGIIPKLRYLHTLKIHMYHLSAEVSKALSESPSLKSLTGHGHHQNMDDIFLLELHAESFPALEHLELPISLDRFAARLNSAFSPRCLKTLSLTAYYDADAKSYESIIRWAARQVPLLESLSISIDDEDETKMYEEVKKPMLFSSLKPLYTCKHLSSLEISHPLPINTEECDLVALVTALPSLRHLNLGQFIRIPPNTKPSISLSTLAVLAPLCPFLEFLCLYISFSPSSNPKALPVVKVPFRSLRTLDVWDSPCKTSSSASVALFLSRVLPRSCNVAYRKKTRDTTWHQVGSVLKVIRMGQGDVVGRSGLLAARPL